MTSNTVREANSAAPERVGRGLSAIGAALAVTVVVAMTALTGTSSVGAQGLPLCGGNQTDHPAPFTCTNSPSVGGVTARMMEES